MRCLLVSYSLLQVALPGAGADEFLKALPPIATKLSVQDVEQALLAELLGEGSALREAEQELRPMFAALPKSAHGLLEPATVRYALHRYFVQKHGWSIQGVDSDGDSWNTTASPAPIMKERAPALILNLFDQRLSGRGFGLRELAAFAATLSDLIRAEAIGKLELVYQSLGFPMHGTLNDEQNAFAMKAYLIIHLLADGLVPNGARQFDILEQQLRELYLDYPDTMMWFRDLEQTHAFRVQSQLNPFVKQEATFEKTTVLLQDFMHEFGPYQNLECHKLKGLLVDMEQAGSGRVPLARFYSDALKKAEETENGWHFRESVEYLRNLGALDETDPQRPSVVITNYLQSEGNCLRPSSFYSVCCMSECEGLLSHLERAVAAPSASANQLATLVAALPSDTVDAPRNLSTALVARLQSVADYHGGSIPLHGRLFAQWLHHAYPRECPFPLVAGTTTPMTPDEWLAKKGHPDASKAQMELFVQQNQTLADQAPAPLPWDQTEELVSEDHALLAASAGGGRRSLVRQAVRGLSALAALAALGSFAVPMLRSLLRAVVRPGAATADKCLV